MERRPDATVRSIRVPLDGSSAADRALGPALVLAHRTGVPLTLLSQEVAGSEEGRGGHLARLAARHGAGATVDTSPLTGSRRSSPSPKPVDPARSCAWPRTVVVIRGHARQCGRGGPAHGAPAGAHGGARDRRRPIPGGGPPGRVLGWVGHRRTERSIPLGAGPSCLVPLVAGDRGPRRGTTRSQRGNTTSSRAVNLQLSPSTWVGSKVGRSSTTTIRSRRWRTWRPQMSRSWS